MIQETQNAENRILIDCPNCNSKDVKVLFKEDRGERTELDVRCNSCRKIYCVSITTLDYSKIFDEEELEDLKGLKEAKA